MKYRLKKISGDASFREFYRLKKENKTSEDELKKNSTKIQEITDQYIKKIDLIYEKKKKDILTV